MLQLFIGVSEIKPGIQSTFQTIGSPEYITGFQSASFRTLYNVTAFLLKLSS